MYPFKTVKFLKLRTQLYPSSVKNSILLQLKNIQVQAYLKPSVIDVY